MFSLKGIKRNQINKLMKKGLSDKKSFLKQRRQRAYQEKVEGWKQDGSFDFSTLGHQQKEDLKRKELQKHPRRQRRR